MTEEYFKIDHQRHILYGVTSLGMEQEHLTVPEGVEKIESNAFFDCELLRTIDLPTSLRVIDTCAFLGCESLESIVLPDGLKTINQNAFRACKSLTSVFIPASVENIGRDRPEVCGQDVFRDCDNLSTLIVDEDNPTYESVDNVLYDKGNTGIMTLPLGLHLTTYTIKEGTTDIEDDAFAGNDLLETIHLPESLCCIGFGAFAGCVNLRHIDLTHITHIFAGSFSGCDNLNEATKAKIARLIEHCYD